MKRMAILVLLGGLLGSLPSARAETAPARDWGPGFRLGEPLGFEDKKFFSSRHAVATGIGFSAKKAIVLQLAYLFHDDLLLPLAKATSYRWVPYFGLGFSFLYSTHSKVDGVRSLNESGARFGIAVRFPIGVEWYPSGENFGLSAEVSPGVGLKPGPFPALQGGLIARYYY